MNYSPGSPTIQPLRPVCPAHVWAGKEPPEREWLLEGWIPWGTVASLYGSGGVGKSLLAQQLLTACVTSAPFLGMPVRSCKAIGLFCEDDEGELWRRQAAINQRLGLDMADLQDLLMLSRVSHENVLAMPGPDGILARTAFCEQLTEEARRWGAQFIVIDTASDTFGGREIERTHVRQFISGTLGAIAKAIDGTVLLLAHPSKSGQSDGSGTSGSTAWENSVRSRLYLRRPTDDDAPYDDGTEFRVLELPKANYAPAGSKIVVGYQAGAFETVQAPQQENWIDRLSKAAAAREVFLAGLREYAEQNRQLCPSKNAPNYAPTQILRLPVARRHDLRREHIERAMEELFQAREIRVEETGPPSRRFKVIVEVRGEEREPS